MNNTRMFFVLVVFAGLASAMAQTDQTIEQINQSINNSIPFYYEKAYFDWYGPPSIADFFAEVNSRRAQALLAVQNITTVSIPVAPSCPATTNASYYLYNSTATFELVCCQVAPLLSPALPALMNQLSTYYLGMPNMDQTSVIDVVINVARLMRIENASLHWRLCKNDTRIHIANAVSARALSLRSMLGMIQHGYQLVEWSSSVLASCLTNPLVESGCVTDTIDTAATPNFEFIDVNALYQPVCGTAALEQYDKYMANLTGCVA